MGRDPEMARRYNASAAAPITLTDWWDAGEPDAGLAGYVGIGTKPPAGT